MEKSMKETGIVFCLLLSLIGCTGPAFGQEGESSAEVAGEEAYKFPEIKPEAYILGGYRFVGHSGDRGVDKYEYLHDSVSLAGELRVFSFPCRVHLDIDIKNVKDYFGDISYAYKDIVLFRGINRTGFHNLENITLIDQTPSTPSPGIDVRDSGVQYGVKTGISDVFLRFKFPDFPFHVYLAGRLVDKDGTQQQMSLMGSGYFNDLVRTSQQRNVNWQTKDVVIGSNSHLGPIELDISHGEKRLDVKGDKVLYDTYTAASDPLSVPPDIIRLGGVFPHNLIPEWKSSSNTLNIHTSYTGGLVASATFSNVSSENRDSGAKASYFTGEGSLTWIPLPRLSFFLRYRHNETDIDSPGTATMTDISNPFNTYSYRVKPALSSATDNVWGTVRYRPLPGLNLKADYTYEHITREHNDDWKLPESTTKNIVSLSVDMRIVKGLTLKARYTYKNIEHPAYNTEPGRSSEGRLAASWVPVQWLNALVSYNIAKEKRNGLLFVDPFDTLIDDSHSRDVTRDRLLGSITFLVLKDLSLTASYAYMHNKTQQDILYLSDTLANLTDPSVPYKDLAHNYAVDLSYTPKNNVVFNAGVSHTISNGTFYPSSPDLLIPESVALFSAVKIKETVYSVSGEYRFKGGVAVGLRYKYTTLDDVLNNPYDDIKNGKAHVILLTLSKRW